MNIKTLKIGFIGAGRVGFTLSRYFYEKGLNLSGFYSRNFDSALQASKFANTSAYHNLEALVTQSDILFITVNDTSIKDVYMQLKAYPIENKILCHCSGALSSHVFENHKHSYSIHPIFAISDKYQSYLTINEAYFTCEGSKASQAIIDSLFTKLGNHYAWINADDKVSYHASLVMASNLSIALYDMAVSLLKATNIDEDFAKQALYPLFINNALNMKNNYIEALTGPVDRNDQTTIQKHLEALTSSTDIKKTYQLLSKQLINVAKIKNPDTNYEELSKLLQEE